MGRRLDSSRRLLFVGVAAAVVAIVPAMFAASGRAATTPTNWTAPFFNFGNTAYNPNETVLGTSNVSNLTQHSSYLYPSGALGLSNILSVGTTIYSEYDTKDQSGQYFEHVTAITPATGKVRWTSSSPVATNIDYPDVGQPGPIAIKSGVIYASAYDHLDAISASTGAILWSYTPQAPQQSGDLAVQAVANGTVYIRDGSANHQIEALNATSGALLWTYETPENIQNAAYAGGVIYIGSGDGNVYAVNTATHTTKWVRYGLGVPFVAFANGTVYELALTGLGQQPGELDALKPFNGHLIWTRGVSDSYLAPMIVGGGYVFVTDGNQLEAFNLANAGIEQWYDYGQNPGNCRMVAANGVIYCADPYNNLVAYNATTGQSLWTLNLPGGIKTAPIVVNGCLWVATTQSGRDQLLSYC